MNQNIIDISTEGNGLADGSVKFTSYPRSAMWTLNRNINANLADGIQYVTAKGGGLWIRNMTLGSPGANLQSTWYVDFVNGNNNADGLTLATAVKNIDEVQARWGDQTINGLITPLVYVHIAGDDSNSHIFSPTLSNFAMVVIIGTRTDTPGLSGTLTTYQNWDGVTKTQCEFSWSGLTGTWIAGQFLALPSLGNTSVIVGKDIGSKTAVSCDAIDLDNFFLASGAAVAFQGYSFNSLSGKLTISPRGEGTLVFQDLELGNANPIDLHWIQITGSDGAQVLFGGCRIYGVDTFNSYLTAAIGCYIVGWRNYGRDLMAGNIHSSVGGAIYRVHENGFSDIIDRVLLLGVPSIDESGYLLIEGDCACYEAFSGWLVRGKLRIDGSFWVRNSPANGNILQTQGGGVITYQNSIRIGATGTATPAIPYIVPGFTANSLPLVSTSRLSGIIQF